MDIADLVIVPQKCDFLEDRENPSSLEGDKNPDTLQQLQNTVKQISKPNSRSHTDDPLSPKELLWNDL